MARTQARSGFTPLARTLARASLLGAAWFAATATASAQSPQALVDAASPGDLVVLPGGSHGTLVINKPLTIIGMPAPSFAQIVLNGTGGSLSISNVQALSDLTGQGFDELRLSELDLRGAVSVLGLGYLEISQSSLGIPLDNVNDIYAPGATVVLLDSTLVHGVGRVETQRFLTANSTPVTRLVASSSRVLANDLRIIGPLRTGQSFALTWQTPGPVAVIYCATGTLPDPIGLRFGRGSWHLDMSHWPLFFAPPSGTMLIGLPPSIHVFGVELAFQAVTPGLFSRPAVGIVR